jgi:hypothetical protein
MPTLLGLSSEVGPGLVLPITSGEVSKTVGEFGLVPVTVGAGGA